MNHKILPLFLCLLLLSCTEQKTKQPGNVPVNTEHLRLKEALLDTLDGHSGDKEWILRDSNDRFVLFYAKNGEENFALIALTHSSILLFRGQKGNWNQYDSFAFNDYASSFDLEDINGDDHKDLLIAGLDELKGSYIPLVFLSDKKGKWNYRPDIKIRNPEYHQPSGMIRSHSVVMNTGRENKELYYWKNDSLHLLRGIEWNFSTNETSMLTFYEGAEGKRRDVRSLKDETGDIFDTAVWNDNSEE